MKPVTVNLEKGYSVSCVFLYGGPCYETRKDGVLINAEKAPKWVCWAGTALVAGVKSAQKEKAKS